jgi:hypothetical protein
MSAFAVLLDARQNGDDAVDGAAQVDAHHPVPVGEGRKFRRADDGDAGIVAKHVDLAETGLGSVRGARIIGAVGDIELQRQHALGSAELSLRGFQMIAANICDDDVHSRTQQRLGDAESDSAGSAGHERGLAGQVLHVVSNSLK